MTRDVPHSPRGVEIETIGRDRRLSSIAVCVLSEGLECAIDGLVVCRDMLSCRGNEWLISGCAVDWLVVAVDSVVCGECHVIGE